jgi:Flp pilus assembly CpaF family ATPase
MDVAAAAEMPRAVFEAQLGGWVKDLLTETKLQLNFAEQRELVQSLIADMLGLGPLEPLIEDDTVTDIMVNGSQQVYVERRGKLELTGVKFRDDDHVMNVATKIVTRIGRRIDESTRSSTLASSTAAGSTSSRRLWRSTGRRSRSANFPRRRSRSIRWRSRPTSRRRWRPS